MRIRSSMGRKRSSFDCDHYLRASALAAAQRAQPPSSLRAMSASRNHISQQSPFFMPTTSAISQTVFMG